jgi:N-acetylglucosamine-6-sulfatase
MVQTLRAGWTGEIVRRSYKHIVLLALLSMLAGLGMTASQTESSLAQVANPKPNFVFILADDMRQDDLNYMPKTRALLGGQGMRFTNAYVSYALCCPSRATILRGQYAHNTGVWSNGGALQVYKNRGYEQDNLATRLDAAGYRTGLFGKYFNRYEGSAVPVGWDDWFAKFHGVYYDYDVNDNGTIRHFGTRERDYLTDVLRSQTRDFIDASLTHDKPFFAYVAPPAPHPPATPAPRHQHDFDGEKAPRLLSFNEQHVSDKPPWIESLPSLDATKTANIDNEHEGRVESLQSLEDLVTAVVTKLDNAGVLGNTYIVFTSDNGWHHGEHRIPDGKQQPYEESINVPLLIRGPGVQTGSTTDKLVLNTDFLPTFTDLAGTPTPSYVDGRSLRPLLTESATTWRTAILLERRDNLYPGRSFYGIRTSYGRKYLEYHSGFREVYNLGADPYELTNSYDATTPPANLVARLQDLKDCGADKPILCRTAEDG